MMKKTVMGLILFLVGLGITITPSLSYLSCEVNNLKEKLKISGNGEEELPETKKITTIKATIYFHPRSLNCKSRGRWITVYIGLPPSYKVEEIDISTILLNKLIRPKEIPNAIIDINGDNVPELMVKFDRFAVILILGEQQFCKIIITGQLYNSVKFEGSYVIKPIHFFMVKN
jgi:hypothetical protein